ncbi:TetR/AcrR family transcriptional regulator [Maribellus sp. CM-23]|uniref:TetR/AcrR family transcriptional regulator n=1 Tax=Maribellus sp. CM-23 TaxID=2781026 RepID=UPI001F354A02|nr:TetR/AcrR family transcriptional regulator [Maribellus sp. CM-23]MCE4566695.1 TetR/AcrR family transcriptional regulator [Maribellus sp. CM-23]
MEEKKEYIIENVAYRFLKRGIRNVTMDDVASEFGISKKTLYQYFSDKEALVTEVVEFLIASQDFKFNNPAIGNAIDMTIALRKRISPVLKMYHHNMETELKRTYPALYHRVYDFKRKRIFDNTMENLKLGISQDLYRPDIDPFFISKLIVGRILYTMNPEYKIFEEYEVHSTALYDHILDYHMHAICTPEGLHYYKQLTNNIQNETSS